MTSKEEEQRARRLETQRVWRKNNPDKVRAQSQRYRAKKTAKKLELLAKGIVVREVWNTGYGLGRPRKGEIRPPSPHALKQKKYRENNEKWKEYNRLKQREWYAKNKSRASEISRAYRWRKAADE